MLTLGWLAVQYFREEPHTLVLDNFLTEAAIDNLRRLSMESTVRVHSSHLRAHVAATQLPPRLTLVPQCFFDPRATYVGGYGEVGCVCVLQLATRHSRPVTTDGTSASCTEWMGQQSAVSSH